MNGQLNTRILDNDDNLPLPEIIISNLGGEIAYVDTVEGRLYSIRDWVYYVSASKNKNRSAPWSDLKKIHHKEKKE